MNEVKRMKLYTEILYTCTDCPYYHFNGHQTYCCYTNKEIGTLTTAFPKECPLEEVKS